MHVPETPAYQNNTAKSWHGMTETVSAAKTKAYASDGRKLRHSHLLLLPQVPPSFAFLHTGGLTLVSHSLQAAHAGLHPPAAPEDTWAK